jgi:hypothetical protein
MPNIDTSTALAILSGVAIAAACGLRAFLPLLAVGVAARAGLVELRPSVEWLASPHALWGFGTAAVVEIAGDKIPAVDHALDAIGAALRPAAATLGAFALFAAWPAPWPHLAALVAGAGALGVHTLKSHVRIGSSALTLGAANPFVSLLEDALALAALAVALFLPLVLLAIVLGWFALRALRSSRTRK